MQSRSLLNLVLLAALAGLGLVAWLQPGKQDATPPATTITDLTPDQVNRIELSRPGKPVLVLVRDGEDWQVAGRPPVPAAEFPVRTLLRMVNEQPVRSYPAAEMDPQRLGLADTSPSARFNDTQVRFGDVAPLDRQRYLQVNDQVHLVADVQYHLVTAPESRFLHTRLLPKTARVVGIETAGRTLDKDEQGHWQLKPEDPQVEADALQHWADEWMVGNGLLTDRRSVAMPAQQVRLHMEDGSTAVFGVTDEGDDKLLVRPDLGLVYQVSSYMAERLLAPHRTEPVTATDHTETPHEPARD